MYGISVFLGEELGQEVLSRICLMKQAGFEGIFTSLHIPEDDASLYTERLKQLGDCAKQNHLKLMVDISGEALTRAGFSFDRLDELAELGVTGLRMDYAISNKTIAEASQVLDIGLNASTITEVDITELKKYGANFDRFEAWHNYYPRPETGLASSFLLEKNAWLKAAGFKVFAFVPGNEQLRGPLYEGLPTLEKHRYENPFSAALDLKQNFNVDAVYMGDPAINGRTINQFSCYQLQNKLVLELESTGSKYYPHVLGSHENRQDEARDVIRSAEARFKEIPVIEQEKEYQALRNKGSVTIDNIGYGRYMGEIQVIKRDLPTNSKVTVVANVVEEDQQLLPLIMAGTKFKLVEKGTLANEFRKSDN